MLLSGIVLLTSLWGNQNLKAQEGEIPELATGNYLTVGAFEIRENAIKLKKYINAIGHFEAEIGYLPNTNYTYVYIKTYSAPHLGYPDVWNIRESTQFDDTWVFAVENDLYQNDIPQKLRSSNNFKYYLTIGTFAIKNNAVNFLFYVQQKNLYNVHVVYSPLTEYFYVYVDTYPTFESGSPTVYEYREQTEFDDTWLFGFQEEDLVPEAMIVGNFVNKNTGDSNTQIMGGAQTTPFTPTLITLPEEIVMVVATDLELAQEVKKLREEDGLTDEEILQQFPDETNIELSLNLSYLNPEGSIIQNLADNENLGSSDKRLLAVAGMVSEILKKHPNLTQEQEEEIYTFLTEEIGQFIFDKNDLITLVDIAVNRRDFSEDLPLDLEQIVLTSDFHLTDVVADSVMQANAELIEVNVVPKTYVDENGHYKMFYDAYYTKTGNKIYGSVEVIDPVRLKQMSIEKSNTKVTIPNPNNQTESIQVIANIFGYKKVQHDFKMSEPFDSLSANFLHFKGDVLMVDFPLNRYETGDIATMYNVYFYKDAAIMKSDSRYELKTLLEMLQENLNYKIKIHGHTNGKSPGKIIQLKDGETDFFTLDGETKEGFGSSKELSLQRAMVIKSYLVSNGVDPSRAEVKGWGGKKPIYDKFDRRALKNVRVEIEIMAD